MDSAKIFMHIKNIVIHFPAKYINTYWDPWQRIIIDCLLMTQMILKISGLMMYTVNIPV